MPFRFCTTNRYLPPSWRITSYTPSALCQSAFCPAYDWKLKWWWADTKPKEGASSPAWYSRWSERPWLPYPGCRFHRPAWQGSVPAAPHCTLISHKPQLRHESPHRSEHNTSYSTPLSSCMFRIIFQHILPLKSDFVNNFLQKKHKQQDSNPFPHGFPVHRIALCPLTPAFLKNRSRSNRIFGTEKWGC